MSRSFRHTPITGVSVCRSEKEWKQRANRRLRVALRTNLVNENWEKASYDVLEENWAWGKDGKMYWRKHTCKLPYCQRSYRKDGLTCFEAEEAWKKKIMRK